VAEKSSARVASVACQVQRAVIPQDGKLHYRLEMAMMKKSFVMRRVDAVLCAVA
jgi:hypothetical protein